MYRVRYGRKTWRTAGNWNGRAYVARFGRWKSQARDFQLSDYFPPEEFDDLFEVARQAHDYIRELMPMRMNRW